ncbi:uncharacterized protein LOC128552204 [Mercenaria mercenaria]|uniref:uncharacterized protein LOC128552204 n=1 Tax=Mercenaria mercenaria TaxID=6596 RepID=UPI00234E3E4A|nr:uncharacterized protein LOC128552204 [Mercenaria mercenaria]
MKFHLLNDKDCQQDIVDRRPLLLIAPKENCIKQFQGVDLAISIEEKTNEEAKEAFELLESSNGIPVIAVHVKRNKNNESVVTHKFVSQLKTIMQKEQKPQICCVM